MSNDVHLWLRALGLEQYSDAFAASDIDMRVLPQLTEADLRELGLSLGHRKILMAAVAVLGTASRPAAVATGAKHQPAPFALGATPERRLLSVYSGFGWVHRVSRRLDPRTSGSTS
jgi:hypothetical protein